MMPNCLRMRGWLCLIVGTGIGMGGFITSYFNLSRIPLSRSTRIVFWNMPLKIVPNWSELFCKMLNSCYLQWTSFWYNVTRLCRYHSTFAVIKLVGPHCLQIWCSEADCASIGNPEAQWFYVMWVWQMYILYSCFLTFQEPTLEFHYQWWLLCFYWICASWMVFDHSRYVHTLLRPWP